MRLFGVVSGEDCLSGEAASSAARHRKTHLFDGEACSRFFLVSSFCPHRKKKIPEYPLNIQLEKVEKIEKSLAYSEARKSAKALAKRQKKLMIKFMSD